MSTSHESSKKVERLVYILVLSAAIISFVIGLFIKIPDDWKTFFSFFFIELGIAGFIALIIIFTIEKFTRDRHENAANDLIERMNNNLFRAIYKRYIPATVFSEVEECLLKTDVLRTEYNIDYALDFIKDDKAQKHGISSVDAENHLFCGIFTSYKLINITDKDIKQCISTHLELPIDENLQRLIGIDSFTIDNDEIDINSLALENTETHLILNEEIDIPANGHVIVALNCHTIKRKLDMEVWASRLPSDGLTLRVTAPEEITVQATANHSHGLKKETINNGKISIWKLEKGMFPFQSVLFWWKTG